MAQAEISKCRICLKELENMKLLTADYLICGEILRISDIITSCTNIQISENDYFPNYICDDCLEDANTAFCFKKRCEQSENFLQSRLNNLDTKPKIEYDELKYFLDSNTSDNKTKYDCSFCNESFNNEYLLDKHKIIHSSKTLRTVRKTRTKVEYCDETSDLDNYEAYYSDVEKENNLNELSEFVTIKEKAADKILKCEKEKDASGVYTCLSCPEIFPQKSELRKHMISHESYFCKLCSKKFTILSNLRRHYKLHDNIRINSNNTEYRCIACSEIFSRRKYLSEHLRTHKEFDCRLCNSKFSNASNLRKHLNWHNRSKDDIKIRKQPPIENRTCEICFKVFKYRPSMLKHRRKHSNLRKTCKFCDETYDNSFKLYKHMEENHKNEKNVECTLCEKKFFKEWNLKMHLITHSGIKPFMCEVCGVSFALAGNLTSHKRLHTGAKPYKCPICSRSFTQQAALRSHEATHSSRRDFICPDCGAAFSRPGALRNHRKRHLNLRPFACTMCGKSFTFSSERKRHMQVHTGEKNYVCDFCGKAFNRSANLNVHRRIHKGACPFTCHICGKVFSQEVKFEIHKNSHKTESVASQIIPPQDILQPSISVEIIVPDQDRNS